MFDPDVAGNGVVFAFVISVILTTLASLVASLFDNYTGSEHALLPKLIRKSSTVRGGQHRQERMAMWRNVLSRLILGFADQQLVTGFAILVSAYIKWTPRHNPEGYLPYRTLPRGTFALVVFFCCGSSSSHLACLLVLRQYFIEHKSTARLRIILVVIFSMFLAVSVALASSLTAYFERIVVFVFYDVTASYSPQTMNLVLGLIIAWPLVVMLWIFWICTLQLLPTLRSRLKDRIKKIVDPLRRIFGLNFLWRTIMSCLNDQWRNRFSKVVKGIFWLGLLGDPLLVFALQIILASLSTIWILLQRFADAPWPAYDYEGYPIPVCSLQKQAMLSMNAGEFDYWGLGQTLPMFLLALPLLSAWETYVEERDFMHKRTSIIATPSESRQNLMYQEGRGSEAELSLLNRETSHDSARHMRGDSEGVISPRAVAFSRGPEYNVSAETNDLAWTTQRPAANRLSRLMLRDGYSRVPSESCFPGAGQRGARE